METSVSYFKEGDLVANRYLVKKPLGIGGMGVVFEVEDSELNHEVVALKVIHSHLASNETIYKRIRNEVLVARSLTHPNIVRTHDIGRIEVSTGKIISYITMELIRGDTLKERKLNLDFNKAVEVLYKVASGVAYAHQKGIIHRDLKPANVIISDGGDVKLADFGMARLQHIDTSLTGTGQMIGTPDYMSPEQIKGESLDTRCDVYALGIMGYELVAGICPFKADNPVALAYKHLNDDLPDLGDKAPSWFKEVLKKATAKNREERYLNAAEFAGALIEFVPDLLHGSGGFTIDGTIAFSTKERDQAVLRKSGSTSSYNSFVIGDNSSNNPPQEVKSKSFLNDEQRTIQSNIPPEISKKSPKILFFAVLFLLVFGGGFLVAYKFALKSRSNNANLTSDEIIIKDQGIVSNNKVSESNSINNGNNSGNINRDNQPNKDSKIEVASNKNDQIKKELEGELGFDTKLADTPKVQENSDKGSSVDLEQVKKENTVDVKSTDNKLVDKNVLDNKVPEEKVQNVSPSESVLNTDKNKETAPDTNKVEVANKETVKSDSSIQIPDKNKAAIELEVKKNESDSSTSQLDINDSKRFEESIKKADSVTALKNDEIKNTEVKTDQVVNTLNNLKNVEEVPSAKDKKELVAIESPKANSELTSNTKTKEELKNKPSELEVNEDKNDSAKGSKYKFLESALQKNEAKNEAKNDLRNEAKNEVKIGVKSELPALQKDSNTASVELPDTTTALNVTSESYSGRIELENDEGNVIESKSISISFSKDADNFFGSGKLGSDSCDVSGSAVAKGVKISLSCGDHNYTLNGSRRESSIRGRFTSTVQINDKNVKGSFDLRKN